ncbi:hypothetical protein AZI86_10360 [Bdellovibrio bacteriovorus]|uniref:HTH lysR-type domain-containing protein n=1 Tax=Bdellovibrio bacteriovorus TaxID=959 RepID=A0A150WSL5_BDEBC|nr:LysR family transcriptional regulator [Bdellovibrio bacteriovorus]KYG67386.1 hypothetical protein AZI86_10360 [Bdellovibrio bacteriovorus]
MKISHLGLQAFQQTATDLNITLAAENLGLTQSALSQRIAQLEDYLEISLFVREPRGLKLTEAGERLLRFASLNRSLEDELLTELNGAKGELAGTFRLAAYSSVLRSLVIPALADFLRKNPAVHIHFQSHEIADLPKALSTISADAIIMDYQWNKKGITETVLGYEEFVAIESASYETPTDVYLDHSPSDNATEEFFKNQPRAPKKIRRSFMGDVYGIIDGVEKGLGRAIMSRHLIQNHKHIRVLTGYNKYKRPITLHYFEQPYYSKLAQRIFAELEKNIKLG